MMIDGLTFDEAKHEYRLNGKLIPSVTQIMDPLTPYSGINEEILNRAAERGTTVHSAIENHIKYGIDEISEEYRGYFEAYLKWEKDYSPEYIASEQRLCNHTFNYAGTADLIARIDNRIEVIDFKTSADEHIKMWAVQLQAYAEALKEFNLNIRGKHVLKLEKNGTYKYIAYPAEDSYSWVIFTACRTIKRFLEG